MLENLVAVIAPHYCMVCGCIGKVLCGACQLSELPSVPSRCYRCHITTNQSQVCSKCKRTSPLSNVWVATIYADISKEIIDKLKFERCSAAASDIASAIDHLLPILPSDTIICHIPTAASRIRVRGYDQSLLIARQLARSRNLISAPLLTRKSSTRQLGAGRKMRFAQAQRSFTLNKRLDVNGKQVLLVDDVTTSGATIEAAGNLLKGAGAEKVYATLFAQAVE